MKIIKEYVQDALEEAPITRDSDTHLILKVLNDMGYAKKLLDGILIPFEAIPSLPSFESITRCRRKFQEEGHYLASKEVRRERGYKEEAYRKIDEWW